MIKNNNKKPKFNLNKRSLLVSILILLLLIFVIGQIIFNVFVWQSLQQQSTFQSKILIVNALEGINDQKQSLVDKQKIPEARLLLPTETKEVNKVRYWYSEVSDDQPAYLLISTRELEDFSQSLLSAQTHDQLFNKVPIVQACNRGITVYLSDPKLENDNQQQLIAKKTLADGREIYIISESQCGDKNSQEYNEKELYGIYENLKNYLTQIQSY